MQFQASEEAVLEMVLPDRRVVKPWKGLDLRV